MRLDSRKNSLMRLGFLFSFLICVLLLVGSCSSKQKGDEAKTDSSSNGMGVQGESKEQSKPTEKTPPVILSQTSAEGWGTPAEANASSSESQAKTEDPEFEQAIVLVQTINLATVSIGKIINTEDRIILDLEYNNIINNLKFEKVRGKEESIEDIIKLYRKIMDTITKFKLSDEERQRFLNQFEKEKHRAIWKSIGGMRAYGATPGTFLFSLVQAGVSAYFNYRDFQADLKNELDEKLWKLHKDNIESINELWGEWLNSWKISNVYNFDSKGLAVIREGTIKDYLQAEQEQDINKSLTLFQDLERNSKFIQSYPPFWLSYAMKLDKAYAEYKDKKYKEKREECLDKFFKFHRDILAKDPIYSKACILRMQSLYQRDSELKDEKTREELYRLAREAENHIEDTDGMGRIFISAIYQKLGKLEVAEQVLRVNIAKKVDEEFSNRALENLLNRKDVISGIPDLAGALIEADSESNEDSGLSIEQLEQLAETGDPVSMFILGKRYYKGKGVVKDWSKAREWYEKAAEKGNVEAMLKLGLMYYNGEGVAKDWSKAREWYEKAAEKGVAEAMNYLGVMYEFGEGVPQDWSKAREWYEKAAEKGVAEAMNYLGVMYEFGEGVPQDWSKAREWYEKAEEKGNAEAMFNLGLMYYNGKGVPQDWSKAREWYEKAAEKGDAEAMNYLGVMYGDGKGVPQDYGKAREWFEKAAEKGVAEAMNYLGVMYGDGKGVPQDWSKAREWCEKAAEKGVATAMLNLGWMYEHGDGVSQDWSKAREWYEKAAEKGVAEAMNYLGSMYASGEGVPQDYGKAKELYEKAAEKGNAGAMNHLGVMYADGKGVPKDYVLAYAYYTLAMKIAKQESNDNVYETSKSGRDGLSGLFFGITKEQVQEAEKIVNSWKPGQLPKR